MMRRYVFKIWVCFLSFSRAKIKTVKLTVAVIGLYIICSAPYICVQLWSAYETPPEAVSKSAHSSAQP